MAHDAPNQTKTPSRPKEDSPATRNSSAAGVLASSATANNPVSIDTAKRTKSEIAARPAMGIDAIARRSFDPRTLPAPPGPTNCTTLLRLRGQRFSGLDDERREDLRGDVPVVHAFVDLACVHEERLARFVRGGLAVVVERHRALFDASQQRSGMRVAALTSAGGNFGLDQHHFVAGHRGRTPHQHGALHAGGL